jgi:hypothetical protein
MAQAPTTATIKCRWWLKHYLLGVYLMARLTGRKLDEERLRYWVYRGIKIEFR